MNAPIAIQFPNHFRGMFHRVESAYRPLIEEGLRAIYNLPVPAELRSFFDHITVESTQPSFMLVPLMFLAAAEASGGITKRHIDALPTMLLTMEVTAVADDTVDRTPMRSGRMTFVRRFGDASSTPFTGALVALIAKEAKRCPPEVTDAVLSYVLEIFSMFLWERANTYPQRALFEEWLQHRYAETRVAAEIAIDSAFALNGRGPLPRAAMARFSYIFQDVDDIVGILESRAEQGENDDLRMGIVTRPLLLTLASRPELTEVVEEVWRQYRPLSDASIVELQARHAAIAVATRPLEEQLRAAILEIGMPATVRCMIDDMRCCSEASPEEVRPFVDELCRSVIERLRHCGHPEVNRILDAGLPGLPAGSDEVALRSVPVQKAPRRTICVYCSSSDIVDPAYFAAAAAIGAAIGERGDRLIFGGSNTGLMGALATAVHAHGGEVIGVIPDVMQGTPYIFAHAHEILVTRDLRTRKAAMEARADAFVVLPGGLGTLDETLEILAAKQMHAHQKPIVLVNAENFWGPMVALFEHLFDQRFASREHHHHLYHLAEGSEQVYTYLDSYLPPPFPAKWF